MRPIKLTAGHPFAVKSSTHVDAGRHSLEEQMNKTLANGDRLPWPDDLVIVIAVALIAPEFIGG